MTGYAHPMAFKAITDDEILKAEKFIREKTLSMLQKNAHDSINEENCDVLIDDEQLRDYFGDLYAQDTTSFQFEAGDILLIKELVDHVKAIADGNGKNTGLHHFTNKNIQAMKKRRTVATEQIDQEKLKMDLQEKVFKCFQLHTPDIIPIRLNINQIIVEVHVKDERVHGEITCVICKVENKKQPKPKRVYYNFRAGGGSWVLSNFVKHLQKHLNAKENETECLVATTNEADTVLGIDDEQVGNTGENLSVIIVEENLQQENNMSPDDPDALFTQLSSQITKTMAAVLKNCDKTENIYFSLVKSPRQLTVAEIPGDNSCMFGALSHQLYNYKITSNEHSQVTKKLRKDVVEHILKSENFPSFEYHLRDRVYEIKNQKDITNMTTECKLFVRHVLSNNKTWGGMETLLAVSELHSTNIVVFNEDGICVKYKRAGQNYDRSIAIAHRLGLNGERNHFDSVSDIGSADLLAAVRYISN